MIDAVSEWKVKDITLGGRSLILEGKGWKEQEKTDEKSLYHEYTDDRTETDVIAVPYFLCNNRSAGEMQVWMRVGRS